ncbi:hypothetical protein [Lentzea sp. NBRC 105346]|nr:hypothetical protein [Lentzea sp. NBRC 105346]
MSAVRSNNGRNASLAGWSLRYDSRGSGPSGKPIIAFGGNRIHLFGALSR